MSRCSWRFARGVGGFTLIEVIGALVIFSVGVLMVIQLSGALGDQMRYAAVRSELAVHAQERLDSLESVPLASLTPGTSRDTLLVAGMAYEREVTIAPVTAVLVRIDVSIEPAGGAGPSYAVTSYTSEAW